LGTDIKKISARFWSELMNILHYSLGFPPYRSGGLTKYSYDLMTEQICEGHNVSLLWPGEIKLLNHSVQIKKHKCINRIASFEIINPIPISYDEGIIDIDSFVDEGAIDVYKSFLTILKPDVIHIHTLMGLHKNFLKAAKALNIRLVFTAHDFFPICPKVTLFRDNGVCQTIDDCSSCPRCNMTALSSKKMFVLQSPLYRKLKDCSIVKMVRKKQRDSYLSEKIIVNNNSLNTIEDYKKIRSYYKSMLDMMDYVHYNSSITKTIYEKYMGKRNGGVLPITHGNIADNKRIKHFHKVLHITYLGPYSLAKGYFRLKKVLDELWNDNYQFNLNVYFTSKEYIPYIKYHDRYNYDELEGIFNETDLLICPSVWYETFGYTVLEALSYGVPVVISNTVGAQDIVKKDMGFVFDNDEDLKKILKELDINDLKRMNKSIYSNFEIPLMWKENQEIIKSVYKK
jgi:glycosyltransferase involved in cell wall biosynthesis